MTDRNPCVEYHDATTGPARCETGQFCCGCPEHPAGRPWGWNHAAWERHNELYHPDGQAATGETH